MRYPQVGKGYVYTGPRKSFSFPRWLGMALLLVIAGLAFDRPAQPQQQQSGGVSLSGALPAGTNVIGKVGIDQTTPGTTNGVQVNAALPAGSNSIGTVVNGAGTASIGKVTDNTSCSTTVFAPAWAAIPTVSTAATSTTTCVEAIIFTNTNSTPQTVTVTDGQGSPITVIAAFSIPGNSQVTFPFYGTPMTTGIKWTAGGTGVTGTVKGYQ